MGSKALHSPTAGTKRFHLFKNRWLQITFLYLLLTIPMTWPVIPQLGQTIPGLFGDSYVHLWNFEWVKSTLLTGQNPLFTPLLFHPVGAQLANHNIAWFHFVLWLPIQALIGSAAAYALVFILNFPLNALATHLLIKRLTNSHAAAFIGGLVAGFWPYNLSHHGHPNLISIWWVPLILLSLQQLCTRQRLRDTAVAGLLIALLGITRWQLLVLSGPLIGLYIGWRLLRHAGQRWHRSLMLLLFAGALSLAIMSPLLTPVVRYQLAREDPEDLLLEDEVSYGADLVSYLLPAWYHPLWGEQVWENTGPFVGNALYVRTIGYTVLLLALIGAVAQASRAAFWSVTAVVHLLLALGSTLYVSGTPYATLPYRWLENVFIFQLIRFPDRFNVFLCIPIAVLAALGYLWLQQQVKKEHYSTRWLLPLIAVLVLAEYVVTYKTLPLAVPSWYQNLSPGADQGLLDIPMCPQYDHNKRYMLYQLQHQKPLVQGHVSRPAPEMFAFIDSVPLLHQIHCAEQPPDEIVNVSEQMRLLAAGDISHLLLHKEYLNPSLIEAWKKWLVVPPVYEDELLLVYETEATMPQDLVFTHRLLADSRGNTQIGLLEARIARNEFEQGNWLPIEVAWGAARPPATELSACVRLHAADNEVAAAQCEVVAATWPTTKWQSGEIVRASYPFPLDPFLSPGGYTVTLSLQDRATGAEVGVPVALTHVTVNALPRAFSPPAPSVPQQATWSRELALLGYDSLDVTGDALSVTLHWQAQRRTAVSYKAFMHLIDEETGTMVAQLDYVPRNWAYPTTWWEAGEYVTDRVTLPLADVSAGSYQLWVGWYDPDTGERLPITPAANAQIFRDDALLLATINR